ncbi:atp-nad kinase [Ophiostoma piceae UAMH 11346]|uniref:Atp-nad kinase n=1 Tax=Ophiostoma piceae (strain UAMH 11346) TaxID=1262450 RepID=S3C7C3_OPHP1|nr:atp-nad kinase [Ophiostoma piceae UAMH 11346]
MASRISSPTTALHPSSLAQSTTVDPAVLQVPLPLSPLVLDSPESHRLNSSSVDAALQRPSTSYNTSASTSTSTSGIISHVSGHPSDTLSPSIAQQSPSQPQQSPSHLQHAADRLGEPAVLRRPQSARAHHGTLDAVPRQTIIKALASVARSHKPEALSLTGVLNATMRPPVSGSKSAGLPSLNSQLSSLAVAADLSSANMDNVSDGETVIVQDQSTQTAQGAETSSNTLNKQNAQNLSPGAPSSSQQLCDALNDLALRNNATPTTVGPNSSTAANFAFSGLKSPCYYHQRFDDAVDIDKVLEEIKNDEYMSHSRLVQTATGVREVSKQLQRRPIRRAVRNIMIVTKARDNQLVVLTRELTQWLLATPRYGSDVGVNVYVDAKLRNSRRFGAASILAANPRRFEPMLRFWTPDLCWSQPEKFDLVITLGGDGTVLFTSWLFQRIVPPVLSFSLGSLGFLTTFEYERFRDHLDRLMGSDGMRVNLRMRFTCTVYRDGATGSSSANSTSSNAGDPLEEGEQFEVLNELVIDRGPSPYVSNLELYGDDELLTVVQADGCIFSTPTGSTAYSLSAGGSLVHPDIPAILLTPICPHTLSFRPMVLSDTMLLRVSIPRNSRATAYCAFDGKGRLELKPGDCVTITASQYPFPTVTRTDSEWFNSVSRTLRWNTRAATQKGFDPSLGNSDSAVDLASGKDEAEWDIDTDSGYYASEEGSVAASPLRRQMSLLGM